MATGVYNGNSGPERESHQRSVDSRFRAETRHWDSVYKGNDIYSVIYQDRLDAVLRMIESLRLPPEVRIVELGCGAGYLAVELARRGYIVHAVDTIDAMLEAARDHARSAGVGAQVVTIRADAQQRLPFESGSVDLVIAVGLIPWLFQPRDAILEMARILRPGATPGEASGGHLLITADNKHRLTYLADPLFAPMLQLPRTLLKAILIGLRIMRDRTAGPLAASRTHTPRQIERLLQETGFQILRSASAGFGPFTLFNRPLFPERDSINLHREAQRLADRDLPVFRRLGSHYIVLARRQSPLTRAIPPER